MELKLIAAGVLFLLKIATGIWLMRSARPHNTLLLTLHKLIALGVVAILIITLLPLFRTAGITALAAGSAILTGIVFLAAIISGGLASTERLALPAVLAIHKATPALALLLTIFTILQVV